jgi:hypothetical protein
MNARAIPSEWDVVTTLAHYPPNMIHECAESAATRLTENELCFLIASYVLKLPRVHHRTMTDAVLARDSL